MAARVSSRRRIAAVVTLAVVCAAAALTPARLDAQLGLDQVLAAYAAGDYQAVARSFGRSQDLQAIRPLDQARMIRWLGAWQRPKAAFFLELLNISSAIAPAYTPTMLSVGQLYVLTRTGSAHSTEDAEFERLWHRIAIAVLQRRYFVDTVEQHIDALRGARVGTGTPWDARLDLARAVAQEQRCWGNRPSLRYSSADSALTPGAGVPRRESEHASRCLEEAARRFEVAAGVGEQQAEARVRAGWVLHQLGRHAEARRSLESADVAEDSDLAFWLHLFRARVHDALDRDADAEREYRTALETHPDAQSAGVGLALLLFRLHRDVEADEAAWVVRRRAGTGTDPWSLYIAADERFIQGWLADLRRMISP
jgi:tetratricopeptide (TPR) repeat protein